MPILRGAVTFARFRVQVPDERRPQLKQWLTEGLRAHAFEPIDRDSAEEQSAGFVELEDREAVELAPGNLFYGERALFAWRVDRLKISAAQARDALTRWTQAFERENGRKPSRVESAAERTLIRQSLRTRAVPVTQLHDISWNLETGSLEVWSASRKVVDEVTETLASALGIRPLAQVPSVLADELGVPDEQLLPTAALVNLPEATLEVRHGEA